VKRGLMFVVLVALVGCSSGGSGSQDQSTAKVVVSAMTPVAGSELQQSSVVEATVAFTIDKFRSQGDTYYLVVEYGDTSGGTLERNHHLPEHPILTAPQGSVVLSVALSKVWANPKLKKPITVWFEIVERVGPNDSVVIGRSEPIAYAAK